MIMHGVNSWVGGLHGSTILYSKTSKLLEDTFSCCVSFREVVLFSDFQNVFKLYGNQLFGTLKCPL